jgi:hypothetical protein
MLQGLSKKSQRSKEENVVSMGYLMALRLAHFVHAAW